MGTSFDDILKKGKSVGTVDGSKKAWKDCITTLMHELHRLNYMYGDDFAHHVLIEQKKCDGCGVATFLITVREINDHKKVLRFHKGDWKPIDEGRYHCEKCK